jgi:hypothetical protein
MTNLLGVVQPKRSERIKLKMPSKLNQLRLPPLAYLRETTCGMPRKPHPIIG